MTTKKRFLDVPAAVEADEDSYEIFRMFSANHQAVAVLNPRLWDDPAPWGIVLRDLMRHVANAYEEMGRGTYDEVLSTILESFQAEVNAPSSSIRGGIGNDPTEH